MNQQESNFEVTGMSCGSCVRHIEHALRELPGVESVLVELATRSVTVQHDADLTPVTRLIEGITEAGYQAKARSPA